MLKPSEEGAKINVEVVFLNVVNGEKIAAVFKKLGVTHIFTYKHEHAKPGVIDDDSREYMRVFTNQMIKKIVNEETLQNAFYNSKVEVDNALGKKDSKESRIVNIISAQWVKG